MKKNLKQYTSYGLLLGTLVVALLAFRSPSTAQTHPPSEHQVIAAPPAVTVAQPAVTVAQPSSVALDASKGSEVGSVYEAYLSPQQEPGEEEDTPALTPSAFRSTAPSVPRNQRKSRGHGLLRFSKDLSRVWVDVKIENVIPADINMFHIHCGKPDQLGPILVDFALSGSLQGRIRNGVFSVVVTNEDIVKTTQAGHGLVGMFTAGCPIVPGTMDKVKTIAGMELIARHSELYFNLHTKAQTFFGDMRGQIHPVADLPQR